MYLTSSLRSTCTCSVGNSRTLHELEKTKALRIDLSSGEQSKPINTIPILIYNFDWCII